MPNSLRNTSNSIGEIIHPIPLPQSIYHDEVKKGSCKNDAWFFGSWLNTRIRNAYLSGKLINILIKRAGVTRKLQSLHVTGHKHFPISPRVCTLEGAQLKSNWNAIGTRQLRSPWSWLWHCIDLWQIEKFVRINN